MKNSNFSKGITNAGRPTRPWCSVFVGKDISLPEIQTVDMLCTLQESDSDFSYDMSVFLEDCPHDFVKINSKIWS